MQNTTTFIVEVIDINGCINTAEITISIREIFEIYFPNIIFVDSKSGNGSFYPIGDLTKVNTVKKMQIYDRWGNLLFLKENIDINNPNQGWNGVFNGQPVIPGVYVYLVQAVFKDGTTKTYNGDFTVLR
ncbi:MAG: gliding motility-associated C-terminal domain-containing protein [Saprospiraceae bacterium]|nr:gliding motility-associated C-terminal domain-containing protein [Saprospiraceae bacterium]